MKKNRFRKMWAIGLVVLALAGLTGCGASSNHFMEDSGSEAAQPQENAEIDRVRVSEESLSVYEAKGAEAGSGTESETGRELEVNDQRKRIRTVRLGVETRDFDAMLASLDQQITESGGYVENRSTYNGSSNPGMSRDRSASMTVRIPRDKLDSFLDTVAGIGNVVTRDESEEDVTLKYVDLDSHKKALETEQNRLLELLEKAETVEDIIAIESRLSEVRYQIESMESQLRTIDNKVDYSTVYLDISEVRELTPPVERSVWERIAAGFRKSLVEIGTGLQDAGVWVLVKLPYLVILALVLTAVILPLRLRRKKLHKAGEKPESGKDPV